MIRSRAAVALAVTTLAVLPTAGCYQGFDNTVNSQGPTGNGTDFRVGDVLVQDTTLVASPTESGRAALIMTLINKGQEPDALASVSVAGTSATLRTAPIPVRPGESVKVGGDSPNQVVVAGLSVPAGSYADVTLTFRAAGTGEPAQVVVVPAVGYYEGYGPAAAVEAVK